jgi:hypothetical protein
MKPDMSAEATRNIGIGITAPQVADHRDVGFTPEVASVLPKSAPEIKITPEDEAGIIELLKPVVSLAYAETVKKSSGPLSEGEKEMNARYGALVAKAIANDWVTPNELMAKAKEQNVIKSESEAKTAAQYLVSAAVAAINSSPEIASQKLSAIRSQLEYVASQIKSTWENVASMAGASTSTISALSASK